MNELLFEIGTEEIPAGYIAPALQKMESSLQQRLQALGLEYASMQTAGTPRRLTITVADLQERQKDAEKKHIGPSVKAAYDDAGNPTKAAIGFAGSRGVAVEALQKVQTEKGEYLMAIEQVNGKATDELLPELLGELMVAIPFPKSMRWGDGSITFARPVQWLLALYNGKPVTVQLEELSSSDKTCGHRFMGNGFFSVNGWQDYTAKLRDAHVVVDPIVRREKVIEEVQGAVAGSSAGDGAVAVLDAGLVDTVTNLVEEPFGVCGSFDEKFLQLPPEVLITSMREHQKYFPVVDGDGVLLPYFVAVNNTRVEDQELAASGHERVLRARLEDALFFFTEDRKKKLAALQSGLEGIIFQNKLGTMLEKSGRVEKLSAFIADKIASDKTEDAKRAARLAKCDLLSEMVGEFPSLQGVMGREYAGADGEKAEVAQAIAEHYMPIRAGSELPNGILGIIVALADRMDTLVGCFGIGEKPTGTTDPFGLRRQALGLLHILGGKEISLSLSELAQQAVAGYEGSVALADDTVAVVLEFIRLRFSNDMIAAGRMAGAVEAAVSGAFDDVLDCQKRITALEEMGASEDFAVLAGSYKRIRNIIKDNSSDEIDAALLTEQEEKDLAAVLKKTEEEVLPLIAESNYAGALQSMLQIKDPLDTFFDKVMVMAEDTAVRQNRLNLLTGLGNLVLRVGDISRMSS